MIDHTGINVSNFEASKKFYLTALAPLGYELLDQFDGAINGSGCVAGFAVGEQADFWICEGQVNTPPIHIAFRADSRELVNRFYEVAIEAGGRDNGAPRLRPHYHPNYYGAFVYDPDGHNIEAVCHIPA